MSELSLSELKKTAEDYEGLLVPALFSTWAERMVAIADLQRDDRVLDVACGTGIFARAARAQLGSGHLITGLDLNPGMLAVAEEKAADISWQQGSAESLPFEDNTFDVVVSQFGLMLFESPEKALREMWRVLRPDGRLIIAVFNSLEYLPAYAAVANVYEQMIGTDVGNALRYPFSMGDTDRIKALFEEAGIINLKIMTVGAMARFANVRQLVLSDVKGWFPFAGIYLDDNEIDAVEQALRSQLHKYIHANGEVEFDVSIHVISTVHTAS